MAEPESEPIESIDFESAPALEVARFMVKRARLSSGPEEVVEVLGQVIKRREERGRQVGQAVAFYHVRRMLQNAFTEEVGGATRKGDKLAGKVINRVLKSIEGAKTIDWIVGMGNHIDGLNAALGDARTSLDCIARVCDDPKNTDGEALRKALGGMAHKGMQRSALTMEVQSRAPEVLR